MNFKRYIVTTSVAGAAMLLIAASASASSISYTTDGSGTGFNGTDVLILDSSVGAAGTITLTGNVGSVSGTPSNIDLADLLVACSLCTTQAVGGGSIFSAFTVDIEVDDITNGATESFVGTSTGGKVFSDVSTIEVTWSPLQLGPGTATGADASGSFGTTEFVIQSPTLVVALNSGTPEGDTSIQGTVTTASATPEPATMALMGGALIGLGLLRKRLKKN